MIIVETCDPTLGAWFARHSQVQVAPGPRLCAWHSNPTWPREILLSDPACEVCGLTELMDNNPMVCADRVSLLGPGGTLASIALGPLARAGLIVAPPAYQFSGTVDEDDVRLGLRPYGILDADVAASDDESHMLAVNAFAEITTPEEPQMLDDLYEEAYGRHFFVNRDELSDWTPALIEGTPRAAFRIRWTPGDDVSLVTVQAMGDRRGKLGAAQIVHAFNVMNGFEETLGLEGDLP